MATKEIRGRSVASQIPAVDMEEFLEHPATIYEDADFNNGVNDEPDVFSRIRAFCDTTDSSGTLGIYRAIPNSRKENFICNIDGADFAPEVIKARFGGGEFIIKAYDSHSKIRLNQRLSIEGEPIVESARPNYPAAYAPPAQSAASALDVAALLAGMQEANRQFLQGLVQVLRPADANNSRAEMLNEMLTMKQLFTQPVQSGADGVSMLMKGIELAATLAPKVGGETSGMDVLLESIKSFAPAIGAVVASASTGNRQQQRPRPQPVHVAELSPPTIPEPQQLSLPEDETTMMLKHYLAMLVVFAAEGRDPALYADLIADNLSDEQLNGIIKRPDVIAYLAGLNPDVLQHREWFDAVISEITVILGLTETETQNTVIAHSTIINPGNAESTIKDNSDTPGN